MAQTPDQRRAARRRYRAECRTRAQQAAGLGVLPQPTAAQRAAADPRNDPRVRAILAEWSRVDSREPATRSGK